jgi:molybdenum cofactor synthesis domain-containing protein
MITVKEAIELVHHQVQPREAEAVPLADSLGRVLREAIVADTDLPPFDRAQMDGYAVRAADTANAPVRLSVVGESAAGAGWHQRLEAGQAVRIMTGAPVPAGADSVQQVEVTRELDGRGMVEIDQGTNPGQNVVARGKEIKAGATVLFPGVTINAAKLASLASFGYAQVKVGPRPRVAVIATGSELVAVDAAPQQDQIRDSNSFTIGAYSRLAGARAERLPLAGDDPASLRQAIADAATRSDLVVLSGGVSMGVYDFTKPALRELGAEIYFEKVRLRPGKPTVFARLGDAFIFGLPGNPVSVSVTFNLFVYAALRLLQGANDAGMASDTAVLSDPVRGSGERESFLPASVSTNEAGELVAHPLKWVGSSDFVAFAEATALINVPANQAGYAAGERVRVYHLPGS